MNKNKILNIILISLIIAILFVLILIGVNFYQNKVRESSYIITLIGLENITIYEGEMYTEPGFNARDINGFDKTSLVKVSGNVNGNIVGQYKIVYSINNFFKKNEVTRIVNVIENPLKNISFSLKGGDIELNLHDEYIDPGFVCVNKNNIDCSNDVSVSNNILKNKIGNYTIDYVLKIGSKEKVLTRNVNVTGPRYEYNLDKEQIVNTDVVIKFQSNINNFNYIVTPNGENVYDDLVNYRVAKNGNYKFVVYDKNGVMESVDVLVNNIDKESPKGSCKAIIKGNNTSYSVTATDNGKITKYIHSSYPNNVYNNGSFIINSKIDNGSVLVYDEASNYTKVICDTDYDYIGVNSPSIYEYASSTLKYWIEKPTSSHYILHIWMDDAYNQLKTALPSQFGNLETASNILNKEIQNMGYSNKGMVALNGSGFVSETFDSDFFKRVPAWKNTAVTPIVIHNEKVLRNFTNYVLPEKKYFTYGLTNEGVLKYYPFDDVDNIALNQQTAQSIINEGVKYTFGFRPILVANNKRVVSDGEEDRNRQAIGQIDKNNFVIISSSQLSLNDIANRMVSLGCHTAVNLDGGGSVNLFYKGNTNQIVTLRQTNRSLADVLYFVEK